MNSKGASYVLRPERVMCNEGMTLYTFYANSNIFMGINKMQVYQQNTEAFGRVEISP